MSVDDNDVHTFADVDTGKVPSTLEAARLQARNVPNILYSLGF